MYLNYLLFVTHQIKADIKLQFFYDLIHAYIQKGYYYIISSCWDMASVSLLTRSTPENC